MRPEHLSLSAFGPFAGEQTFDFSALGAHRLFLIHGPTGAGKTTLLDALCFALFGSSSGAERQPANLRSQHADPGTPTWVELAFSLGADRYRIRRSPPQTGLGKRGKIMDLLPSVTLWRHDPDGRTVLAEQDRRVREEVERLLGYSDDEFRQVVMLPQGRFREVLTARPGERQAILATLFRTSLYRRIEQQLAARARLALDEAKQVEERRRTLLSEAGAASPEAAAALVEALAAQHMAARDGLAPLRREAELAASLLVQGRLAAGLLEARAKAAARLEALLARLAQVGAARTRLESARRAATTVAPEQLYAQARGQADGARNDAEDAAAHLRQTRVRSERADLALADAAARDLRIDAWRTEATRLVAAARSAHAAEAAEARAAQLAGLRDAARNAAGVAEAEVQTAQQRLDAATKAAGDAAGLAETLGWKREALDNARRLAADLGDAAALAIRLDALRQSHGLAVEAQAVAGQAMTVARDALLAAEAALRAHHAATLARELRDGAPCPVCGGLDHPRPWVADGSAEEDAADPEAAARLEAEAAHRLDVAREQERRLHDETQRVADQLDTQRRRLPPDLDAAAATARVAQAHSAVEAAEAALARGPLLSAGVGEAGSARQAALRAAEAARASLIERDTELATVLGEIQARRADSPAANGTAADLTRAAERLAGEARAAAEKLEQDRNEKTAAATALQDAERQAAREASRAADAEQDAAKALAALLAACSACGFADPAAALAAHLSAEQTGALSAELETFDRDRAQAEALAEQSDDAARDLVPPDLAGLTDSEVAAREAFEAAARSAAQLDERHQQAARRLKAIDQADIALAAARDRHGVLRDMASATSGQNERRLSLEGFVLTSILDEALAAANHHLSRMLGGRYLVRRREEPGRANAAVGLDIEVLDEWTGQQRPAGTLSGGEGFCAALALALGLADTVQAHAGARRIDTLFIDEGFGALDEDALDTAMDVLTGLQAGDRLVGIISHVAELRARIPAQLIVRPGHRGSSAAFQAI